MLQTVDSSINIKVIGVGGGGNNAAIRIMDDNITNVETYLLNTETSKLKKINPKNVLQIGRQTTKGLGAGANERIGEASAIESSDQIRKILEGTDMLFLTAGMGGGTGTGAIPVIAKIAKDMGILTVAIVTKPFGFEGKQRSNRAEIGIEKLKDNVNALVVVMNDKLLKLTKEKITVNKAFELADNILEQGIQSTTDLITTVGDINIDFADIQTIFNYKGKAYMGIGVSREGQILEDAVKQAVENPCPACGYSPQPHRTACFWNAQKPASANRFASSRKRLTRASAPTRTGLGRTRATSTARHSTEPFGDRTS